MSEHQSLLGVKGEYSKRLNPDRGAIKTDELFEYVVKLIIFDFRS